MAPVRSDSQSQNRISPLSTIGDRRSPLRRFADGEVDELSLEIDASDGDVDFGGGSVFDLGVAADNALKLEIEEPVAVGGQVFAFDEAFDEEILEFDEEAVARDFEDNGFEGGRVIAL